MDKEEDVAPGLIFLLLFFLFSKMRRRKFVFIHSFFFSSLNHTYIHIGHAHK